MCSFRRAELFKSGLLRVDDGSPFMISCRSAPACKVRDLGGRGGSLGVVYRRLAASRHRSNYTRMGNESGRNNDSRKTKQHRSHATEVVVGVVEAYERGGKLALDGAKPQENTEGPRRCGGSAIHDAWLGHMQPRAPPLLLSVDRRRQRLNRSFLHFPPKLLHHDFRGTVTCWVTGNSV